MLGKKTVIIVGAGASGLGAARWLVDNDVDDTLDVIVIEARDRIGGRVNTSFEYDIPIDLGAAWLHDHKPTNPMSIMAKTLGVSLKNTNFEKDVCYNTKNVKYADRDATRNWSILEKAFVKAVKSFHQHQRNLNAKRNGETNPSVSADKSDGSSSMVSSETDLESYIKQYVSKDQWDNPLLQAWIADYDFEFGTAIKNLSPAAVDEIWIQAIEQDYDDYDMMFDQTGYVGILQGVVSGAATDNDEMRCRKAGSSAKNNDMKTRRKPLNIKLNHRVLSITDHTRLQPSSSSSSSSTAFESPLPPSCYITIEVFSKENTDNNTDSMKVNGKNSNNNNNNNNNNNSNNIVTMNADMILCTLPLGVLKSQSVTFYPALSLPKQLAIQQVGFGNVVKVVMEFSKVFWPSHTEFIIVADESLCSPYDTNTTATTASTTTSQSSSSTNIGTNKHDDNNLPQQHQQQRGLLTHFWNLFPSTGRKVLVGFGLGDGADCLDQMTDSQVEALIHNRMSAITTTTTNFSSSSSSSSLLIRWSRTHWATDPYSCGAYSYVHKDYPSTDLFAELGRCESECLWFAGEATHTHSALRATVTGAWLSGIRAAEGIVRTLHQQRQQQKQQYPIQSPSLSSLHDEKDSNTTPYINDNIGHLVINSSNDILNHNATTNNSNNNNNNNSDDDDHDEGVYTSGETAFLHSMISLNNK